MEKTSRLGRKADLLALPAGRRFFPPRGIVFGKWRKMSESLLTKFPPGSIISLHSYAGISVLRSLSAETKSSQRRRTSGCSRSQDLPFGQFTEKERENGGDKKQRTARKTLCVCKEFGERQESDRDGGAVYRFRYRYFVRRVRNRADRRREERAYRTSCCTVPLCGSGVCGR